MISNVKQWLDELSVIANNKKEVARSKGEKFIWYSSNKNQDIKMKFSEEGEKLPTNGRLSSRSSGESTGREWLYDFTLREFDKENNFVGVPLVAEIELSDWQPKGLVYDFNKLLQSDAKHRVFVFQQKKQSDFENIMVYLDRSFKAYIHKTSSKFLVACWLTSEYRFIYKEMRSEP